MVTSSIQGETICRQESSQGGCPITPRISRSQPCQNLTPEAHCNDKVAAIGLASELVIQEERSWDSHGAIPVGYRTVPRARLPLTASIV